ncbi:hypothetical protein IQ249_23595 [Lusitaniella coriacea LEGE 07157]|uniref:Uncharacterized protein n=1 Tax=Lusitaniella coriacea LEGE 07157 TaxID=945747 RepID=A0A8J7IXN5_9CYAN|nr:hypothetical protein [Lusitaniella coriacea]MBE9118877.1 hypothetical protein [Lusitaniella coriacea LEGE 07157]
MSMGIGMNEQNAANEIVFSFTCIANVNRRAIDRAVVVILKKVKFLAIAAKL